MNIYEKIQLVKESILNAKIKKSGENKFAGFKYYELADITPTIVELCNKHKLYTGISFTKELALLTIINIEKPDEILTYTSPMEELELKGCNKIQALGGTETYQRRYLYMSAFDIIEPDMFDKATGKNNEEVKATDKQIAMIRSLVEDEEAVCNYYKIEKLEDLSKTTASEIIKRKTNNENN